MSPILFFIILFICKEVGKIFLQIKFTVILMAAWEGLKKELNWLPFPKRDQCYTCLTVYESITRQAPEYISSLLTYVSDHHERQQLQINCTFPDHT